MLFYSLVPLIPWLLFSAQPAQSTVDKDPFTQGQQALEKKDFDRAIACFTEAIHRKPTTIAYLARASAHVQKGDLQQAFADCDDAIRLDPKFAPAHEALAALYTARAANVSVAGACTFNFKLSDIERRKSGRFPCSEQTIEAWRHALDEWDTAARLGASDSDYYQYRAIACISLGRVDRALSDMNECVRFHPNDANALCIRGGLYAINGELSAADRDLSDSIRIEPSVANVFLLRSQVRVRAGKYDLAIGDANRAINLDPRNADAFNARATAHRRRGEYRQAVQDATEAIRLSPDALYHLNRARAQFELHRTEEAFADCNEAIRLGSEEEDAYRIRAQTRKPGDYRGIVEDLSRLLEIKPRQARAHWERALAYTHLGDHEKAFADYAEAIRLAPADAQAHAGRASLYLDEGLVDGALKDANRAIELDSKCSSAYLVRAMSSMKRLGIRELKPPQGQRLFFPKPGAPAVDVVSIPEGLRQAAKQALDDLNTAIRLDPTVATSYRTRAMLCLAMKEIDRGVDDFASAASANPSDAECWYYLGMACLRQRNWARAVASCTESLRLLSDRAESRLCRGTAYWLRGDAERAKTEYATHLRFLDRDALQAIGECTDLLNENPKLTAALAVRGVALAVTKKFSEAMADLDEAVRRQPGVAENYRCRGYALACAGKYDSAIADYSKALRLAPPDADTLTCRAEAFFGKGAYKEAIADSEQAIRLSPTYVQGYFVRSRVRCALGQTDAALADLIEAGRLDPKDPEVCARRAAIHLAAADYDAFVQDYTDAIYVSGGSARAYAARARAYLERHDYEAAIADGSRGIKRDPKEADGFLFRGLAYSMSQRYDAALADFSEVIRLSPSDIKGYTNRARTYYLMTRYPKAIEDLGKAIQLDATDVRNYNGRGLAYAAMCDPEHAVADFSRSLQLDPGHPAILGYRADAYVACKRYDDAIADYTAVIALRPDLGEAYLKRADAYFAKRQYAKAIGDYSQVIACIPPTSPDVKSGAAHETDKASEGEELPIVLEERFDSIKATACLKRALCYEKTADFHYALCDLNAVVQSDPRDQEGLIALAWLLAACPDGAVRDGRRAVILATQACELSEGKSVEAVQALAAAYAECGKFGDAIAQQKKALQLPFADRAAKGEASERLNLYEGHKPYRQRDARSHADSHMKPI